MASVLKNADKVEEELRCSVAPVLGTAELPESLYYHSAELVRDNLALVICGSSEKGVIHSRTLVYELTSSAAGAAGAAAAASAGDGPRWSVKLQSTIPEGALRKRYSPATATFPRPAGGWYAVLYGGASDKGALDDILSFSPNDMTWTPVVSESPEKPPGGTSFSLTTIRDMVYVLPTGPAVTRKMYGMLLSKRTWHSMNLPWDDCNLWYLFSDGSRRLVFLGAESAPGASELFTPCVHEYDIVAATWSEHKVSGPMPPFRVSQTARVVANRFVVLLGGMYNSHPLSDMAVYDMVSRTWANVVLSKPLPLYGAAMVAVDDRTLILFGGRDNAGRLSEIRQLTFSRPLADMFPAADAKGAPSSANSPTAAPAPAAAQARPATAAAAHASAHSVTSSPAAAHAAAHSASAAPAAAHAVAHAAPRSGLATQISEIDSEHLSSLDASALDALLRACQDLQVRIITEKVKRK